MVSLVLTGLMVLAASAKEVEKSAIPAEKTSAASPTPAPVEDVDEIVTNKKMRAESGSKSRLSLSNSLSYYGGSLEKPLAENRPNITSANSNTVASYLSDSVAAKIALNKQKAINVGVGLRWITPLYGSPTPAGWEGHKFDIDNPYVNFQSIYRWSGIQSVFTAGSTFYTADDLRARGYANTFNVAQNNIYEIGRTGVSLGLLLRIEGTVFSKHGESAKAKQSDYTFGFWPFFEYQISDWLNFRTLVGLYNFEHHRSVKDWDTFSKNKIYQSVGFGISVARDIFLYPNVQFLPENIRSDRTNVALSANINLF